HPTRMHRSASSLTQIMERLERTMATPAENVALDEALLELAEDDPSAREFLRLWESPQPMVVVGRSSRIGAEVNVAACDERGVSVLRRSSGGAAVVAGPGCFMYALVLDLQLRPEFKDIARAHALVLERIKSSLARLPACASRISRAGTSDLVVDDQAANATPRKFSGNSLRLKRTHLLYHGTLMYGFDPSLIETCLKMPPRQPDYRAARPHAEFVTNLPATRQQLIEALDRAWPTEVELNDVPLAKVRELVATRFGRREWNYEFA